MIDAAALLTGLGLVYLLGLVADWVGRHTMVPRVALLLAAGFAMGPDALGLIPETAKTWFPLIADIALVMVGFLVGGALTAVQVLPNGVYITMNGRVFYWDDVRKNQDRGVFELIDGD